MADADWLALLIRVAASSGVVVLASLAAERVGPFLGGLIAALPVSTGVGSRKLVDWSRIFVLWRPQSRTVLQRRISLPIRTPRWRMHDQSDYAWSWVDAGVAGRDLVLVEVVEFQRLGQGEDVLLAVIADQSLGDCLYGIFGAVKPVISVFSLQFRNSIASWLLRRTEPGSRARRITRRRRRRPCAPLTRAPSGTRTGISQYSSRFSNKARQRSNFPASWQLGPARPAPHIPLFDRQDHPSVPTCFPEGIHPGAILDAVGA